MAEYIPREALVHRLKNPYLFNITQRIFDIISEIPAADVAPVVHGWWEYNLPTINTYGQLKCSICNWWTLDPSVDSSYSYCPNCGAKMDGGDGHAST